MSTTKCEINVIEKISIKKGKRQLTNSKNKQQENALSWWR